MGKNIKNVVFIITDQQRYDSLGCTGNKYAVTPNLDKLGEEGVIFDRFITNSSICSPSRASIITGLQSSMHGVWTNGIPLAREEYVPVTEYSKNAFPGKWVASHITTFADVFKKAGYKTISVGKLHLTPTASHPSLGYKECTALWREKEELKDWHGPYYGFDDVEFTLGHGEIRLGHYGHWLKENYPEVYKDIFEKERYFEFPEHKSIFPSVVPVEAHNSTWIGNTACKKIKEAVSDNKPFLLWVGFPDPHSPFAPPEELAKEFSKHDVMFPDVPYQEWSDKPFAIRHLMEKRKASELSEKVIVRIRQYTDAMNHLIDINVGKIISTLKELNIWDETVVIFTSDHGDFLGDYGMYGKCTPCCESLNHVPFIMHIPGYSLPKRIKKTISGVDIFPTICELTGVEPPKYLHGESILSIIQNGRKDLAMVQHYTPTLERTNISVYTDRFRFTWYTITDEKELYDHKEDPHELDNLAKDKKYRNELNTLLYQLMHLQTRTCAPRTGRIPVW